MILRPSPRVVDAKVSAISITTRREVFGADEVAHRVTTRAIIPSQNPETSNIYGALQVVDFRGATDSTEISGLGENHGQG